MNFSYMIRLACLIFASYFWIHTLLGLAVQAATPSVIRRGESIRARSAARLLFILRLLPTSLALLVILGFCIPSYLWLEPEATAEKVGFACFAAALLGLAIWGISVTRMIRVAVRSIRYTRQCREAGQEMCLAGHSSPALVVEGGAPLVALAGVIHSQLVISRNVLSALSSNQLDAALRHEQAHRVSRDNFKRLLLFLAPEIIPFSHGFSKLERGWARFTEWAADDSAIEGDSGRSLSLAAALVRVARMGLAPRQLHLLSSLISSEQELSERVDRLLRPAKYSAAPQTGIKFLIGGAGAVLAGLLAIALFHPATFYAVHDVLEHLIR